MNKPTVEIKLTRVIMRPTMLDIYNGLSVKDVIPLNAKVTYFLKVNVDEPL